MDEQSLEDLLALIEVRNITLAARRRNLSQPAYSRRLQAIEARQGVGLVDRSVRPARPTAALEANRGEIESTLAGLKRLRENIVTGPGNTQDITIATVQALASRLLPAALGKIKGDLEQHRVRLRAENHNQSFQMLMTEEVLLMLAYETRGRPVIGPSDLVEKTMVARDSLVPVCAPEMTSALMEISPGEQRVPLIDYPRDNFMGIVLLDDVLAHTPHQFSHDITAGLTNAVMGFVRSGFGVAWLPHSLVADNIARKEMDILTGPLFPTADMNISMLQLKTKSTRKMQPLWAALAEAIQTTIAPHN